MASWPDTLPKMQIEGYSISPVNPSIRTDMEGGAPRMRRRTKARNDKISPAWVMTDAQLAIFRAWFDSDTGAAGGSAWFTASAAIGTGGIVAIEARFVDIFSASRQGSLVWAVTAELEVR